MANAARRNASGSRGGPTRTRGGKNRYPRYRGLPDNANNHLPPTGAKTPFISLVSKSWAQSSGNLELQMVADPEDFTILSLQVPDVDLDLEDLEYLGDDEDLDNDDSLHGADTEQLQENDAA